MRGNKADISTQALKVREEIRTLVGQIYLKGKKDQIFEVHNTQLLIDDLGFDSMEILELITKVEKKFRIEIPDDNLKAEFFTSIDTVTKWVIKLKETKQEL